MKRVSLMLVLMVAVLGGVTGAIAQERPDRGEWLDQMRQYKRAYFTKELDLNREQQKKFFPLYEEMTDQTSRIENETRTMERRIAESDDASDLEYEKGTEALFDMKAKQAEVEKGYMEKFRGILTAKQLFELKGVERSFARDMMRQHNRLRSGKRGEQLR